MKAVAYYRVSTARQGVSKLGLEAQREAVRVYLAGNGWPPVAEFTEVESGSRNDRPQLAAALAACRLHRAVLVVAKLDRLARNVAFVSALMESGVEFVAVDFPMANRLTVHILAAVAEHEREMISARTKAALNAAKARGKVLGGYRGHRPDDAMQRASTTALKAKAQKRADDLRDTVAGICAKGMTGPAAVARELNSMGLTAGRGGAWSTTQAARLMAKLAPAPRRRTGRAA